MQKRVLLLALFSLSLSACSGQSFPGSQLFSSITGSKESKPIPLKALKAVSPTIKVKKAWQIKTGSAVGSHKVHPFVSRQNIYVAGGRMASAWNKNSSKAQWKTNIGETISAGVSASSGTNNQLFLGTSNGNAISLDAKTGKVLWVERLSSEIVAVSNASNNRVVFRTIDGKIHGLTSQTGEIIWQQTQRTPALSLYGASVPKVVGTHVISGFDNGKIAAYSLQTGAPAWEASIAEPRGSSELERMVDVDGKIKILGKALFANSLNGNMAGIKLETGEVVWAKRFSSATGADVDPQGLYASDSEGNVWKLQPQTGTPLWKMDDLQRRNPTTPKLVNSSLAVVGDKQGNLHWINTTSGKFVARNKGDLAGFSVEPEVDGNAVFALGKSGVLTKLQLN